MPTFDRDTKEAISAKLASGVGEKVFEAIFNCIMRGGKVEDCLKAGQEKMKLILPIPDPLPFKTGFIELLTQYKTHLYNQMEVIDDVIKRLG